MKLIIDNREPQQIIKYINALNEMVIKQLSILLAASKLCKKGAYLVYATCSMLEDENEKIVSKFDDVETVAPK